MPSQSEWALRSWMLKDCMDCISITILFIRQKLHKLMASLTSYEWLRQWNYAGRKINFSFSKKEQRIDLFNWKIVIMNSKIAVRGSMVMNHLAVYCITNDYPLPEINQSLLYDAFNFSPRGGFDSIKNTSSSCS